MNVCVNENDGGTDCKSAPAVDYGDTDCKSAPAVGLFLLYDLLQTARLLAELKPDYHPNRL